jgi:hypothetical protein
MYKHDAEAIRFLLADLNLWGVEITDQEGDVETATVDAFQGREKKIILVHFVAANPSGNTGLGHIANARRLCVATTRAQEYQFFSGNLTHWVQHRQLENAEKMQKLVGFCRRERQVMEWNNVRLAQAGAHGGMGGDRHAVRVQDVEELNGM